MTVTGGVGIGGNLYVGGTITGNASSGTTSTNSAELGYLGIPQNLQSTNYILVAGDQGKQIYVTSTSTLTVPANSAVAFPIGTAISVISGPNVTTTISCSDTLYLGGLGTTGTRTLASFGMSTLVKVSTNAWYISGTGLS